MNISLPSSFPYLIFLPNSLYLILFGCIQYLKKKRRIYYHKMYKKAAGVAKNTQRKPKLQKLYSIN